MSYYEKAFMVLFGLNNVHQNYQTGILIQSWMKNIYPYLATLDRKYWERMLFTGYKIRSDH